MDNPSPSFLFHQPQFVFRNTEDSILTFRDGSAHIYFSREAGSLFSIRRAPFGSFITNQQTTSSEILAVIDKVVIWSRENGIKELLIRSFPDMYNMQQHTLITDSLLKSGFIKKYIDVTQIIEVTDQAMDLDTHKKRRLRKARTSAFTFSQLPVAFLEEGYSLFVESRQSKGYPITMSLDELAKTFREFPQAYMLFGVFDDKKLVAAAICIKVNPEILYCFYIGDSISYRRYSPVTFLVQGIYAFCQSRKFRMIDLGISSDKGVLNHGLYKFKKSFGSVDSFKLTFLKQL